MQRNFAINSKWLYFKLYASQNSIENIVGQHLFPLIHQLEEENLINRWFFLRYKDTNYHIRFRVSVNSQEDIPKVWNICSSYFNGLFETGLIWNISMDMYKRELERYTSELIEFSEFVFYKDSEMIINFLSSTISLDISKYRILFAIKIIDHYFTVFNVNINDRLYFLEEYISYFKNEFQSNKEFHKKVNHSYIGYKVDIENILNNLKEFEDIDKYVFSIPNDLIVHFKKNLNDINNDNLLLQILGSYIHMSINRLFITKNRENEYVLYEFIYKYYKTLTKRKLT